jgi:hypothetical protein
MAAEACLSGEIEVHGSFEGVSRARRAR